MLSLLLLGIALFWVAVLVKVERGKADVRWRLGPQAPVQTDLPRLAVVIPARDEARNIAACVAAVRKSDHPSIDLLVFDDGSIDDTVSLAESAGARTIRGEGELPVGWKGKPWALQRATATVDADWILFLDADVRITPEAASRIHTYALGEQVDLLSGLGRLTMGSFWEKVIQPSVGGLILGGNAMAVVNDPAHPEKAIANGQMILVRRTAYQSVGGHAAVKDNILDDIGLARAFTAAGLKVRCLFMRDLFSCRMYAGLSELWLGWTKNLFAGMHYKVSAVIAIVLLLLVDFLLPYLLLLVAILTRDGALFAASLATVVLMQGVRLRLDLLFGQSLPFGLLQPLGAAMLIGLVIDSARRTRTGQVRWKRRSY